MAPLPKGNSDVVRLAPLIEAHLTAAVAFASWSEALKALVPHAFAIEHVGSTSIDGCMTKGDLDIVVRVRPGEFAEADANLASRFARNLGSACSSEYSPFVCDDAQPPLGVQLVVTGSEFDCFHTFRDALLASPALLMAYNALKVEHLGCSTNDYRRAKEAFVADVLTSARCV